MFQPRLLVLVGNGVSIAANPNLALDRLTERFLARHNADAGLNHLLDSLDIPREEARRDFERVIGGVEAAEAVIRAFMELSEASPISAVREAGALLDDAGVPDAVRHAYCSEVLHAIGELTRQNIAPSVLRFGEWLNSMHEWHGQTAIFTLNYDVLLERMLINADILGLAGRLTDYFSGLPDRQREIELVPGEPAVVAKLFTPTDPPDRPVRLHHLHGCLTHFHELDTGNVLKVDSALVRDLGVYQRFGDGDTGGFLPAVILGSQKARKVTDWPFEFAFEALREALRSADVIAIAGYSFRDEAVNIYLRNAVARRAGRRWIVIDQRDADDSQKFERRVVSVLPDTDIEWCLDGLQGELPQVR